MFTDIKCKHPLEYCHFKYRPVYFKHTQFQRTITPSYICRHDEMDRLVREKETSVAKVRESGLERERALQSTVRELSKRVEDLQGTLRQSQWTQQDAQKENEATMERYTTKLCKLCLLCYRQQTKLREGIYAEGCVCLRWRGKGYHVTIIHDTYPQPHPAGHGT